MDVSAERFEELVVDALDAIPEDLGTEMENVAVFIEEWPTTAQLGGRRGTLFGLYEGISLTRRSPINYSGAFPDRITIFRGPITRAARDEDQLARDGDDHRRARDRPPLRHLRRPPARARMGLTSRGHTRDASVNRRNVHS